ncbi:MAG: hypothetical protein ACLVJK_06520 [Alistipes putredinis]
MEIEQQIWGATSEGEAVVLYTLRNRRRCRSAALQCRRGCRVDSGSRS